MKAYIAGMLSVVTLFTSTAWAIPVNEFDRLSSFDQNLYVIFLMGSAERACQDKYKARRADDPAQVLYDKVIRFFGADHPHDVKSKFSLNLAYGRVADLLAVEKNPKVKRLEVEDVFYMTLMNEGITFPNHFKPTVSDFTPHDPVSSTPVTMEQAQELLKGTQAWMARTLEPIKGEDLFQAGIIHPPDQVHPQPSSPSSSPVVRPHSTAVYSGFSSGEAVIAAFVAFIVAATALSASSKSSPDKSDNTDNTNKTINTIFPPPTPPNQGFGIMGQPCLRGEAGCHNFGW